MRNFSNASHIKSHIKNYHKHERCPKLEINNLIISYHTTKNHGTYHFFQVTTNNNSKFINLIENDLEEYRYKIINPEDKEYCAVEVYGLINDI